MSDATPIVGPWNADGRPIAPTYEQIVRHAEKHTGRWWRWHPDGDGRGSTPEHWRCGALVCPCDAIGNPLRWDDEFGAVVT